MKDITLATAATIKLTEVLTPDPHTGRWARPSVSVLVAGAYLGIYGWQRQKTEGEWDPAIGDIVVTDSSIGAVPLTNLPPDIQAEISRVLRGAMSRWHTAQALWHEKAASDFRERT